MLPFSKTAVAPLTKGQASYKKKESLSSKLFRAICLILFRCNRNEPYSGAGLGRGFLLAAPTLEISFVQFIY